jgi:hypothetical protein
MAEKSPSGPEDQPQCDEWMPEGLGRESFQCERETHPGDPRHEVYGGAGFPLFQWIAPVDNDHSKEGGSDATTS